MVMLRESSMSTPRKFCCGTAAFRTRAGRSRQKRTTAMRDRRRPTRMARSRGGPSVVMPRYVISAAMATADRTARPSIVDRDAANVKSPCSKTSAGYLKKSLKSPLTWRHSTGPRPHAHRSHFRCACAAVRSTTVAEVFHYTRKPILETEYAGLGGEARRGRVAHRLLNVDARESDYRSSPFIRWFSRLPPSTRAVDLVVTARGA